MKSKSRTIQLGNTSYEVAVQKKSDGQTYVRIVQVMSGEKFMSRSQMSINTVDAPLLISAIEEMIVE